jgi:prepilin-type N-terminal cleavage/methylation domain-containing protein
VRIRIARPCGFTLMELLIATGLFAVAVTGLIALFPTAQRVSREGEEESRATLIAGSILDTLAASSSSGCFSLATGTKAGGELRLEQLDPRMPDEHSVAYGSSCEPLFPLEPEKAGLPVGNPEVLDIATLTLKTRSTLPGLVVAEVDVVSPAAAPASGRSTNRFVRLFPMPADHD